MTSGGHRSPPDDEAVLEMMGLGSAALPSFDDIPSATHWPSIPAARASREWQELRVWVDQLQRRFSYLDYHVIPPCWWRHNEHVEALVALRDHERVSYLPSAPASAPVEWMRALRDIAALLRSWTAEYGCGSSHQEPSGQPRPNGSTGWDDYVAGDVRDRHRAASGVGVQRAGC